MIIVSGLKFFVRFQPNRARNTMKIKSFFISRQEHNYNPLLRRAIEKTTLFSYNKIKNILHFNLKSRTCLERFLNTITCYDVLQTILSTYDISVFV